MKFASHVSAEHIGEEISKKIVLVQSFRRVVTGKFQEDNAKRMRTVLER